MFGTAVTALVGQEQQHQRDGELDLGRALGCMITNFGSVGALMVVHFAVMFGTAVTVLVGQEQQHRQDGGADPRRAVGCMITNFGSVMGVQHPQEYRELMIFGTAVTDQIGHRSNIQEA